MNFPFLSIAWIPALLGCGLLSCQKAEPPQTVLAQVDQSRLTLEEVRENFPPELEKVLSREQYLNFLQRWVEDEVVYQQALKQKLDEDPKVRDKLKSMRRKVLIEEFLARESAGEDYEPDEGAMSRYYEMHKDAFRRASPEFRFVHLRVGSLKEAQAAHNQIKGDNFAAVAARYSMDSAGEPSAALPFRRAEDIPLCLMHELSEAKLGNVSAPITCPDGFYVIKLVDRVEAGTPIPFSEAKDAISSQLAMEHKDEMRAAKIRQYKEGVAISLNVDQIPGLENVPENPEAPGAPQVAGAANALPNPTAADPADKPIPKPPAAKRHHHVAVPKPAPSNAAPASDDAPAAAPAATPAVPAAAPPEGNDHAPAVSPDP